MPRYVHVNPAGLVINAIVWDGNAPYNPGAGHNLIRDDAGAHQVGDLLTPATIAVQRAALVVPAGAPAAVVPAP